MLVETNKQLRRAAGQALIRCFPFRGFQHGVNALGYAHFLDEDFYDFRGT